jgi:hypothetical protein
MEPNETITQLKNATVVKSQPEDVKDLWDRWDKAQKEDGASEYVKGWNLLGVGLFITGAVFQILGSGFLQARIGPILVITGAVILAVKKYQTLRSEKE